MAKGTSPWVYVGVGCLLLVILGVVVMGAIGYFGYREAKRIEQTVRDPEARSAAAWEILGTRTPPEDYHVMAAFSVPLLMDVAVLSDREPDGEGQIEGFDERGFIYAKVLSFDDKRRELEEFFEGKRDSTDVLRDQGIRVRRGDLLARGELEPSAKGRRLWVAQRGGVEAQGAKQDGITTLILVKCPEDDGRLRMGVWFGPDPDPESEPDQAQLAGSVADPAMLAAFLERFELCPATS